MRALVLLRDREEVQERHAELLRVRPIDLMLVDDVGARLGGEELDH